MSDRTATIMELARLCGLENVYIAQQTGSRSVVLRGEFPSEGVNFAAREFDPDHDHNDWKLVEDVLLEKAGAFWEFLVYELGIKSLAAHVYARTPLPTRVDAAVRVLREHHEREAGE